MIGIQATSMSTSSRQTSSDANAGGIYSMYGLTVVDIVRSERCLTFDGKYHILRNEVGIKLEFP